MNGIIYYIYQIESGKGYIGKHCRADLYARFKAHLKAKTLLGNALRKYGEESFKVILLDTDTSDEKLLEKEVYWIDRLETLCPKGYNLTIGGQGYSGYKLSEETCKAYSMAKKGIKFGPCPLQRISATIKANRVVSPEEVILIRSVSDPDPWYWSVMLDYSYQTIMRIISYKTLKDG